MSTLPEIRGLCVSAAREVHEVTRQISAIDATPRRPNIIHIDLTEHALKAVAAAVADARAPPRIARGALVNALKPLAAALLAFGEELTGPAGRAAAAAATRAEECRVSLGNVCAFYSGCFIGWFKILESMDLVDAREGEIPRGALAPLFAVVPFSVAAIPVLLEGLGGGDPAAPATPSRVPGLRASMMGTLAVFMEFTYVAYNVVRESYDLRPCYRRELAPLRSKSFSVSGLHGLVLQAATDAVLMVTAADAALAGVPAAQAIRASMRAADTCGLYVNLSDTVCTGPDPEEDPAPDADGSLPTWVIVRRMMRLMCLPGFSRAFLAAVERSAAGPWPQSAVNLNNALLRCALGASAFSLYFVQFSVMRARATWPPEGRANAEALLAPEAWDRLVAASGALREAAATAGLPTRDRIDVTAASITTSLLALHLAMIRSDPSVRLDLDFMLRALAAFAAAWNADSAFLDIHEMHRAQLGCQLCASTWVILELITRVSLARTTAGVPRAEALPDLLASLQAAIALQEDLASVAGSIFATLQAHVSNGHAGGGGGCKALRLAAAAPKLVYWVSNVVRERCLSYKLFGGGELPPEIARAALRAAHVTLAAARAYAAAPWASWAATFSGDGEPLSVHLLKSLPNALLLAASFAAFSVVDVEAPDLGVPRQGDPSLAALSMDVIATMDCLWRAAPDAFSVGQTDALAAFVPDIQGTIRPLPSYLAQFVATADSRLGLAGYLAGLEPGVEALALAVERSSSLAGVGGAARANAGMAQTLRRLGQEVAQGGTADEAAQKARARALAALPCARLGCERTRRPGEAGQRPKKCSGCLVVRYCGPSHQKQDWKGHKLACKAIAAEREAAAAAPAAAGAGRPSSGGGSSFAFRF